MSRVKGGNVARNRRKKVLKEASGYFGSKHRLYKSANEQVNHSLQYAYNDRRKVKSDFRKLWIKRINAACHQYGVSYSQFMYGLKLAKVEVNRKMLSEMAINDELGFKALVDVSRKAVEKQAQAA